MQIESNISFGFVMLRDVNPGHWFRYEANQLFFRTEQENEDREILCVDTFGRVKHFKGSTNVMKTEGTYVEAGAEKAFAEDH